MTDFSMTFRGLEPRESTSWAYGARVDNSEPLEEQFWLAHQTYNKMVETARAGLAEIIQWFGGKDPGITRLTAEIDGLSAQWAEAKARDDREQLKVIAAERAERRKEWYERCFAVRKEYRTELTALVKQWVGATKDSRLYRVRTEAVKGGLYWATATAVMTSVQRAWDKQFPRLRPLAFSRRAEKLRESLTVQFTEPGGAAIETLHAQDTRLWIEPPTEALLSAWANNQHPGRAEKRLAFRMRVGGARRDGIYIDGTVTMHRPVPAGAHVMMARLVRERVATRYRYSLQLVLRLAEPMRVPVDQKAPRVGLDLGWYYEHGRGRRVIAYTDTGDEENVQQIYLDPSIDRAFDIIDELASRRDLARDDLALALRCCQWSDAPPALAESLTAINKLPVTHVAQSRLARLILQWRSEHPDYRPDVLTEVEAWRAWDKRLYEASANLRKKTINRRKDFYRNWAHYFATHYETIVVVRPDLRDAAIIKDPISGEHTELAARARQGRVRTALYDFLQALPTKASETGSVVIELHGHTSTQCAMCGELMTIPDDAPATRTLVCDSCGVTHDREANSAALAFRAPDDDEAMADGLGKAQEKATKARERREKRRESMRQGRWKKDATSNPDAANPETKG